MPRAPRKIPGIIHTWTAFTTVFFLGIVGICGWLVLTRPPTHIVGTSPGGAVFEFMLDYEDLRRAGYKLRIDGTCISACTLFTGIFPKDRVCVTQHAALAFHSASVGYGQHSPEGTRIIWRSYPEEIRALLRARGWDGEPASLAENPNANEQKTLIYIEYPELRKIYQECRA